MGAVAEAVQSALPEHGFIKDRHPLFHAAVGGDDSGTAGVPFDQQIIEVGSGLAGKLLQSKIIHNEQIGTEKAAQLAVEGVIGAGAGQVFQEAVVSANQLPVPAAATGMPNLLGEKLFPYAPRT